MFGVLKIGKLGASMKRAGFNPRTLFSASEPGAWYDPSDMSTLFQDEAGTVPVTAVEQPVGRMLDKSGRGNHAFMATTTKRPAYSRRVNIFQKTEDFSDAYWPKQNCTVAANLLIEDSTNGMHLLLRPVGVPNATNVMRVRVRAAGRSQIALQLGISVAYFDILGGSVISGTDATIHDDGDGWFVCSASKTLVGNLNTLIFLAKGGQASYQGDGVSGVQISYASLTLATDAHLPYQRVNTATDYDADPSKFPAYRRLDGVDDSHASATGGGGTAGFFFSAAVTPQGGAGTARTLFSDAGTNTGYIVRLNTSNKLELAAGNGTAYTTIATSDTLAVGTTDVVQAWDDGTNLNVKIGTGPTASIARPAVAAGTTGYTMGQDNGASTGYFNGRTYSAVYTKDMAPTQAQREAVSVYQRRKAMMA